MSYKTRKAIYGAMHQKYGRNARVSKIIEELSELIAELSKVGQSSGSTQKLCDEIADVKVGLEQLEIFFAPDKSIIEKTMDFKVERTKAFYLSNEEEEYENAVKTLCSH